MEDYEKNRKEAIRLVKLVSNNWMIKYPKMKRFISLDAEGLLKQVPEAAYLIHNFRLKLMVLKMEEGGSIWIKDATKYDHE